MKNDCAYFSENVVVNVLEHFVEAKLAKSLHGVSEESRRPALAQPTYARFPQGHTEAIDDATVFARVDLDAAFDQIQRNHRGVRYPTAKDATEATQGIVLAWAKRAAVRLSICNAQSATDHNMHI